MPSEFIWLVQGLAQGVFLDPNFGTSLHGPATETLSHMRS